MKDTTPPFDDPRMDYSARMLRLRVIIAKAQAFARSIGPAQSKPHPYCDAELNIMRAQRDLARLELDRIRPLLYDTIAPEG